MTQIFTKLALALVVLVMSASIAFAAMTVEAAKSQGLVGEKPDGLLGVVVTNNPEATALADQINAERLAKYAAIASKNGTAVDQVQALAGKKLISGAADGEYIMNAAGEWQKK